MPKFSRDKKPKKGTYPYYYNLCVDEIDDEIILEYRQRYSNYIFEVKLHSDMTPLVKGFFFSHNLTGQLLPIPIPLVNNIPFLKEIIPYYNLSYEKILKKDPTGIIYINWICFFESCFTKKYFNKNIKPYFSDISKTIFKNDNLLYTAYKHNDSYVGKYLFDKALNEVESIPVYRRKRYIKMLASTIEFKENETSKKIINRFPELKLILLNQ